MDDILTDVNESWAAQANGNATGMQQFKGSDDYLRTKVRRVDLRSCACFHFWYSLRSTSQLRFHLSNTAISWLREKVAAC